MRYSLLAIAILILAISLLFFAFPALLKLWDILLSNDIEVIAAHLRNFGSWAVFISLFGNTIVNISGLPTVFFSGANGLVFGFWGGVAISWLAEILGSTISFLLFRATLYKKSKHYIQKYKNLQFIERLAGKEGFRTLLIARLIPLSPSGIINIAAAASPISFPMYSLATAIGKLPSVIAEVYVGRDFFSFEENKIRISFWIILVIGAYIYSRNHRKSDSNAS